MSSAASINVESLAMTTGIEEWVAVCPVADLLVDEGQCALVKGRQVALFRLSGSEEIYALDNHDPFSEANVISRGIVGDIKGRVVVASPVYKQHFELGSGKCLEDETVALTSYPVRVVNGQVQIAC